VTEDRVQKHKQS